MADSGQKTEQPTLRRLHKAREEGQFPSAKHFVSGMQFLLFVAVLGSGSRQWFFDIRRATHDAMEAAFNTDMTAAQLTKFCTDITWHAFSPLVSTGGMLLIFTVAVQLAVTKFGVSLKKLAPDMKRLSPLAKLKQMPGQNIPALLQALIMLPVFGSAVYFMARDNFLAFVTIPLKSVSAGASQVTGSLQELLWKASVLFMVFGAVDLLRQRKRYSKELRMSKQEIRDEVKEMEGNPQMKMRIRRIRRDLLRRRMMQAVPTATAVIVNPTHFAVAIRYEMKSMAAPVVVAKGKNYLALRIRQKAVENQVPLVENPPLAQALYKSVEVGQEIPAHLYKAVAEILAYIYRLMHGRMPA